MADLKVMAVGSAMVVDLEALDAGVRRFVGRVYDPASDKFVAKSEVSTVPDRQEYRQALKEGDLKLVADAVADKSSK